MDPVIIREGAALRTPRELCVQFIMDTAALCQAAAESDESIEPTWREAEEIAKIAEGEEDSQILHEMTEDANSILSGIGYVAEWEDGYVIWEES